MYCHVCASDEVEEGPVGGYEQGVHSLVLFYPPEGLCLQTCLPLINEQIPDVGYHQGAYRPTQ